jgi:anti-sigma regulatory factor (Ser/Thr protein kinase)
LANVPAHHPRRHGFDYYFGLKHLNGLSQLQELDLSYTEVTDAGLIAYLQESISHQGLCAPADCTRIAVALAEALSNALYHGNLEVGSVLRAEDDQAYWALVSQRSSQRPYSERQIFVSATLSRDAAEFVICDQGPGFDPQALPDPTDPANLEKATGRGILLMRAFMDEMYFNAAGNSVTLKKYCRPRS